MAKQAKRKKTFTEEELRPKKSNLKIKIIVNSSNDLLANHPRHREYAFKSTIHQELALERMRGRFKNIERITILKKIIRLEREKRILSKKINVSLYCRKGETTCNIITCSTKCIYNGCEEFIKAKFLCFDCRHIEKCYRKQKYYNCSDRTEGIEMVQEYLRLSKISFKLKLRVGICKPMFYPGSPYYEEAIYGNPKKWYGAKYEHLKGING